MPSEEEIKHQMELLATYRRTLRTYLTNEAKIGSAFAPPFISSGIVEAREHIARIKAVLHGWAVQVEDYPDDTPPVTKPVEKQQVASSQRRNKKLTLPPKEVAEPITTAETRTPELFKQASSTSATSRRPAPTPVQGLLDEMKDGNVVPFIGAGLSMAALPNMPDAKDLLRKIASRFLSEEDNRELETLLTTEIENSSEAAYRFIHGKVNDFEYDQQLRLILDAHIDWRWLDSPPHKFLNALPLRRIITTNYDRLLERQLTTPFAVITSSDTKALHYFMRDRKSPFILKLHGDVARPDTIRQSELLLKEIRDKEDQTRSPEAELLLDFLREVFRSHTVLFLGTSLTDREGFYELMKVLASRWGQPVRTHYALVPHDPDRLIIREEMTRSLGIKMLSYKPDKEHSQVWEFISFLNIFERQQPNPGDIWYEFFKPKDRGAYLKRQLDLEQRARAVRFLTPKLTSAISTDDYLKNEVKQELLDKVQPEENRVEEERRIDEEVMPEMFRRRNNLRNRLINEGLEVRVLFLQKAFDISLEQDDVQILRRAIDRYQDMLVLADMTDLEIRLIPDMTEEQLKKSVSSYALIISEPMISEARPFVDISIAQASQATINFFEIHTVQMNTDEANARLVEFERIWTAALSEKKTMSYIQKALDEKMRILGKTGVDE